MDDACADMRLFSDTDLRRFIRASEHHRRGAYDALVPAAVSKRAMLMAPGALRLGQTRLSFDIVGVKLADLLVKLRSSSVRRYRDLLREDALRGTIGPDRRYAVIEDGNHKLAALLALDGLILLEPRYVDLRDLLLR